MSAVPPNDGHLVGGAGNDIVPASDSKGDRVNCGPGFDRVGADLGEGVIAGN